jgi:hypothetical protein
MVPAGPQSKEKPSGFQGNIYILSHRKTFSTQLDLKMRPGWLQTTLCPPEDPVVHKEDGENPSPDQAIPELQFFHYMGQYTPPPWLWDQFNCSFLLTTDESVLMLQVARPP